MKTKLALSVFLLATIATFAQIVPKKKPIEFKDVNYIEIIKVIKDFPSKAETKRLTQKQCADFAQKWNESTRIGADKYEMTYFINVVFTKYKARQFSVNENKIQESNWITFDIKDRSYFDDLWNAIK